MTQFETYVPPVIEDSDEYKPRENYGHAVIVCVKEYKASVVTSNSPEGGPAVIVDVVDMDAKGDAGEGGVYRNVLMMTGSIVDGFKAHAGTGKPLVVSWTKRVAASGRPYAVPEPATAGQLKAAEAWYAKHGDPFAQKFETVDIEPPF